jgi:anti-sigma regulatory factor (Ser/Thr protein kinase)
MDSSEGHARTFRVTPAEISAADIWIEDVARKLGVSDQTAFRARVCVAEVAANVLEHGGEPGQAAEIAIMLHACNGGLDIEITDTGRPFDITTAPARPLPESIESANIGGLGLHLVRSYASDITYRRDGAHNHLTLRIPAATS